LSLVRTFNTPYIDENSSTTQPPVEVKNNVSLKFTPAFFDILNAGSSGLHQPHFLVSITQAIFKQYMDISL
jgi:hypothetical protein